MNYNITFRKRAAKEYLEAIDWYRTRSLSAAENFVKAVNETLDKIESQPDYYRRSFKQFQEAKTRKYPYSIVYFIDEESNRIVITSIFHQKRNPFYKFRIQDFILNYDFKYICDSSLNKNLTFLHRGDTCLVHGDTCLDDRDTCLDHKNMYPDHRNTFSDHRNTYLDHKNMCLDHRNTCLAHPYTCLDDENSEKRLKMEFVIF